MPVGDRMHSGYSQSHRWNTLMKLSFQLSFIFPSCIKCPQNHPFHFVILVPPVVRNPMSSQFETLIIVQPVKHTQFGTHIYRAPGGAWQKLLVYNLNLHSKQPPFLHSVHKLSSPAGMDPVFQYKQNMHDGSPSSVVLHCKCLG